MKAITIIKYYHMIIDGENLLCYNLIVHQTPIKTKSLAYYTNKLYLGRDFLRFARQATYAEFLELSFIN